MIQKYLKKNTAIVMLKAEYIIISMIIMKNMKMFYYIVEKDKLHIIVFSII